MRKMWQSNKQPWATFDHVSPEWRRNRRGTRAGAAVKVERVLQRGMELEL